MILWIIVYNHSQVCTGARMIPGARMISEGPSPCFMDSGVCEIVYLKNNTQVKFDKITVPWQVL